jgi:hypothetical protein
MESKVGSNVIVALDPVSKSTTPSTWKFVLPSYVLPLFVPFMLKFERPVASLVVSPPVRNVSQKFTPGTVAKTANISRPFKVRSTIWLEFTSLEFSLEAVCTGVSAAVTDTCSVNDPNVNSIRPKS